MGLDSEAGRPAVEGTGGGTFLGATLAGSAPRVGGSPRPCVRMGLPRVCGGMETPRGPVFPRVCGGGTPLLSGAPLPGAAPAAAPPLLAEAAAALAGVGLQRKNK